MNISFYDGINDGKFFNISAGKYDDLDDIDDINVDDIDISEEIKNGDDNLPCEECECPGLEEVKNEISTHLAMINKANMRLNQLDNKISDLKEFRDETYELQYGQLLDRLNLIEKKIDAFKCIDILDKVTKLEEKVEKLEGKYLTNHNSNKLAIGRLYERLGKVEPKLAATAQIVDAINGTISGYGRDYVIIADRINELESKLGKLEEQVKPTVLDDILDRLGKLEEKVINTQLTLHSIDLKSNALEKKINEELDWKDLTGTTVYESIKNDILDSIKRLEEDSVSNDIQSDAVNHPKHYTDGKYECIDFIEEYGMITHVGNAIKYVTRAGIKDEKKYAEDLNKAFWYLHRYNAPKKLRHIDPFDYAHDKMLADDLVAVISAIVCEDYKEAEKLLGDYITKITGKTPKALEDEQSK